MPDISHSDSASNTQAHIHAELAAQNATWLSSFQSQHPGIVPEQTALGQSPSSFVITCVDSRYNESALGFLPGQALVYASVGNLCDTKSSASSFLSTLEFAVNLLKVKRVIILGHTDCGGIKAVIKLDPPSHDEATANPHFFGNLSEFYELKNSTLAKNSSIKEKDLQSVLELENVKSQTSKIKSYVTDVIGSTDVEVVGMLYHVEGGHVEGVC
ncbi:hypothetical protein TBLA_0B05890 [Henningerozyma blattae CBS 6284]|uniref:Carbonic anhydrase n=1 Tax=Henningerozyma blattae (strain ATCC 34711 / CBS 6284 / DSM 70876 / NBRC 10599 / NRRL Y-10934 / UCD 77-7) TaxID=1071380 RepID=I2GZ63_HENB6|nr:hypothetical protein TBLA_0B05890 [Tetrapisispora blattae CBS 6284]CCH59415.1 hypothetical protein TBLA_0B05890 [Tetrapisispora blattae CBS 6284]